MLCAPLNMIIRIIDCSKPKELSSGLLTKSTLNYF